MWDPERDHGLPRPPQVATHAVGIPATPRSTTVKPFFRQDARSGNSSRSRFPGTRARRTRTRLSTISCVNFCDASTVAIASVLCRVSRAASPPPRSAPPPPTASAARRAREQEPLTNDSCGSPRGAASRGSLHHGNGLLLGETERIDRRHRSRPCSPRARRTRPRRGPRSQDCRPSRSSASAPTSTSGRARATASQAASAPRAPRSVKRSLRLASMTGRERTSVIARPARKCAATS